MTIRRASGASNVTFLRQTYGGATMHLARSLDVAFSTRPSTFREKRLIGMRATSSSAGPDGVPRHRHDRRQFARYLGPADLTVVTASLDSPSARDRPVLVVSLGGVVTRASSVASARRPSPPSAAIGSTWP
jgi:hypothetical protein